GRHLLRRGGLARARTERRSRRRAGRTAVDTRGVAGRTHRRARHRRRARGRPQVLRARRRSRRRPLPRGLGYRRRVLGTLSSVESASRAPDRVLGRPGAAAWCTLSPPLVLISARRLSIPRLRVRTSHRPNPSFEGTAPLNRRARRTDPPDGVPTLSDRVTLERGTTTA